MSLDAVRDRLARHAPDVPLIEVTESTATVAEAARALGAAPGLTGHPVGGVRPFGLATPLPIFRDRSPEGHASVFPAAGSLTSSVELSPARPAPPAGAGWVDACAAAA